MWTIPEPAAESNPADGLPAKSRQVYTRLAMKRGVVLLRLAEGVIVRLVAAAMLLSLAAAGPARAGRETISDGDRIAAMGFSHGGSTVLAAWHTQRTHPDVKLRALGATVEYNPRAHEDSEKQVKNFLAAQLRS